MPSAAVIGDMTGSIMAFVRLDLPARARWAWGIRSPHVFFPATAAGHHVSRQTVIVQPVNSKS
jgi:hypothetical protein